MTRNPHQSFQGRWTASWHGRLARAARQRLAIPLLSLATIMSAPSPSPAQSTPTSPWPAPTKENKPWTRWWWLGSAVDDKNLTALMEQYHAAGLGGLEICPIYGAKGYEDKYLQFLSQEWNQALAHTLKEGQRLDLGIDLTTGTGWPFGGPNVPPEFASMSFHPDPFSTKSPIQKVKRAAPGGEGNVLDPYSVRAMDHYVERFTTALNSLPENLRPRAHFHDSFEYYGANWTPTFFDDFQRLRGYDLHPELPALAGKGGDKDHIARVKYDYRQTIADLHLAYVTEWSNWAHKEHGQSREQAHGAPGNLLDLYAAADIPECEIFGGMDQPDNNAVMLKFASSAAHTTGKPLASSESFTWLGEHFQVSLADCKPAADHLFLAGINHLFFHGTPYSPDYAGWPGWLFYAAVNFGPHGGLFADLPAFTAYITRIQSVLQAGKSDNDLLLYFPIHDIDENPDGLLIPFQVHNQSKWLRPTPYFQLAQHLQQTGYAWDAISDAILEKTTVKNGRIVVDVGSASADAPPPSYAALILPKTHYLSDTTAKKLAALANDGAAILFQDQLPADVPGLKDAATRRATLQSALANLHPTPDIDQSLREKHVRREPMFDQGLACIRRARDTGADYFIVNPTEKSIDTWIPLATRADQAQLLDPRRPDHYGAAALRTTNDTTQVYLQLPPGASIILRTNLPADHPFPYTHPTAQPTPLQGTWQVTFTQGGPNLPKPFTTDKLSSWTDQPDEEAKRFAGTAQYTLTFPKPDTNSDLYLLDLGKVAESARITLNGHPLATLFNPPFAIPVHLEKQNTLEVEVTNLAANRIADLDRRHVNWKGFHEINFVNKNYKPFDASNWPLRPSGLLGPVTLTPITPFDPQKEHP